MSIQQYDTIIFDCDGVVLNSNTIKSEAFYSSALSYGECAARKLLDYHLSNGGISRYEKFSLFLKEMISKNQRGPDLEELLEAYSSEVRRGLISCDIASGLSILKEKTVGAKWLIVSGGDERELKNVFAFRGIDVFFDGGIYGSPDSKEVILERLISFESITGRSIFLGDSYYDFYVAKKYGLDFAFISGWSEWSDWMSYSENFNFNVKSLHELAAEV